MSGFSSSEIEIGVDVLDASLFDLFHFDVGGDFLSWIIGSQLPVHQG